MAETSWLRKIHLLKKLIEKTGPLWPKSTKLAGFASDGPYHCLNCEYLKGAKSGNIFKDDKGDYRCIHSVMVADPEVEKDSKGIPIITNPDIQCCEFVSSIKGE